MKYNRRKAKEIGPRQSSVLSHFLEQNKTLAQRGPKANRVDGGSPFV